MRSESLRSRIATRSPFTSVPKREPRSFSRKPSGHGSTTQWRRLTSPCRSTRAFSEDRPIVRGMAPSSTCRRRLPPTRWTCKMAADGPTSPTPESRGCSPCSLTPSPNMIALLRTAATKHYTKSLRQGPEAAVGRRASSLQRKPPARPLRVRAGGMSRAAVGSAAQVNQRRSSPRRRTSRSGRRTPERSRRDERRGG